MYRSALVADKPHDVHLLVTCARECAVVYWDVLHCGLSKAERLQDSHLHDALTCGLAADVVCFFLGSDRSSGTN